MAEACVDAIDRLSPAGVLLDHLPCRLHAPHSLFAQCGAGMAIGQQRQLLKSQRLAVQSNDGGWDRTQRCPHWHGL